MQVRAIKTRLFKEREDLIAFILKHVKKIPDNTVLVVASKIVALAEGRTADLERKESLIKKESSLAVKTKKVWLTIKGGMIMADGGIDESNAAGKIILLPLDSFKSAARIRSELRKKFRVKNLGIIISDSGLLPLRSGVIAQAVGYAGFLGVKNYVGKSDIFGRKLKYSKQNIADSLATTAALCMGEGAERQPLAVINNAPVKFIEKVNKKELKINLKDDMYAPLLNKIN